MIECWNSIELQKKRVKDMRLMLPCHEPELEERIKKTPVLGL